MAEAAAIASAKKTSTFDLKKVLRNNVGYLYLLPWIIGFLLFKLYPFMSSLYYSMTDYNQIGRAHV